MGGSIVRVDIDKLRENVTATAQLLRGDDSAGHVRPRVTTRLIENVHARSDFVQYDRDFSFECDESEGRAGRGEHPSPLRYFLSGLAFCQQVWYAKASALVGCELDDLVIHVLTYMDMRGEHHVGDAPAHPQWIIIEAEVTSTADAATVLAMVDEANSRCPVYALVAKAVPIYERIQLNGSPVRDTVPEEVS
jgi:uncharacterized OsmC-like protein